MPLSLLRSARLAIGRRDNLIAQIAFATIAIVVVVNSYPELLPHAWGDSGPAQAFINPSTLFHSSLYSWNPLVNTGGTFPDNGGLGIALLPYALFGMVLHAIGATPGVTQALFVWLVHFFSMVLMYRVLKRLLPASSTIAAINGAVAYDLSVFVASTLWRIFNANVEFLVLIPFTLLVVIRIVEEPAERLLRFTILTAAELALFAPAITNLAYLPTLVIAAAILMIWLVKFGGRDLGWRKLLGRTSLVVGCALTVNAWYVVPTVVSSLAAFKSTGRLISNSFILNITESTSLHTMLLGLPNGPNWIIWGTRFARSLHFLLNPGMQFLALLLFAIVLIGIQISRTKSLALLGVVMCMIGLFLSQGSSGITGSFFLWCFDHIPFFTLLRIPTQSSVPFLVPGLAIGLAAGTLAIIDMAESALAKANSSDIQTERAKSTILKIMPYSILGVVILLGWPMTVSGAILTSPISYKVPPTSTSISLPSGYNKVAQYLSTHDTQGYRTLILPLSTDGQRFSEWKHGATMTDQSWLLLRSNAISGATGSESDSATFLNGVILGVLKEVCCH